MRKKRLVTLLLPSLLLAPLVLAQAVQADEATQASSERTDNLKTETVAKASETGSKDQESTTVETFKSDFFRRFGAGKARQATACS